MPEADQKPWEMYQAQAAAQAQQKPWDLYKQAAAAPQKETPSWQQSALYGAGQGATFGFSDEGLAGAKALYDKVTKGGDLSDLYQTRLEKERQDLEDAKSANPVSYYAGNLGGAGATMLVPGLNIAKGASLGASVGRAALQGGLMGAGESTANPLDDPTEFAKDVGKGAAIGGTTQGLLSAGGGILNKFTPSSLNDFAEDRAVKAVTGQNIKALRKMAGTTLNSAGDVDAAEQGIRKVGRDILNEGVLQPLDKVEDLAPKLAASRKNYGSQIGEIGKQIDQAAPSAVNAKNIAEKLTDYASSIPETEAGKKLQDRILAEAANFEKMGSMSFADAQAFKNQFQYKPVDADALISSKDATNKIRSIIGGEMDDTAKAISQTAPDETRDLLNRYKELKGKYGSFKGASDAATDRVEKNLTNRFISPSDYGAAGTVGILSSMSQGGPSAQAAVLAGLGALTNKFARERGSALAATTADSIAKVMENSPEAAKQFGNIILDAANRGPAALVATHAILMKRPEYRAQFEQEDQ